MRIQCLITRSFLTRYLYGELGERFGRRVRSHLDVCERCRARAREAELLHQRILSFRAPVVSDDEWDELWDGVLSRVASDEEPTSTQDTIPFPRHRRSRYVLVVAAAAVLVAGAVVRLALAGNQSEQTPIASFIQYHENAVDGHVLLEDHFWSSQVLPVSYAAGK